MALAERNGICANCAFPFPNAFLNEISRKLVPDLPETSFFEPGTMAFKIMKILPECINRPGFETLKTYLEDDARHLKLFQLSEKIAETLDQYLVFRPEMIFLWEEGKEDHWQARIWRELVHGNEKMHRARLQKVLLEKIRDLQTEIDDLPQRVSIFGISYLPPFHMQLFAHISRLMQVNLFIMNPCMGYWADIVSDREIMRIRGRYLRAENISDDLHLEKGNKLLASMGALGRDFFSLISGYDFETVELFEDQGGDDMLSCIQSDILYLREREYRGEVYLSDKTEVMQHGVTDVCQMCRSDPYFNSIQVHSCHSPMREIEVMYDNLLAMFEEDHDLKPKDIIVLTPDIESYAPFIHAVFDAQADDALRIPFSIADQSIRKESRVIDGFLSILDLKDSRFGAAQVLALLELPGIKEKFGLAEPDMEIIERWIRDTRIRWGIDSSSRLKLGLPGFSENTWKFGIERLLLGYAMPGHDDNMFCGILPYDEIEGGDAKILGKFLEFLDSLFNCADTLDRPRTLTLWNTTLIEILEQFFVADEDTEREIQVLRRVLDDLAKKQSLAEFDDKIELDVIRSYLGSHLEKENFGSAFISGGVTFCAMLPMRSIPFKVICLVGMNTDAFPRDDRPLGFDLVARYPKPGDRSRRNDDKYLFLEALISARKKLYISYVGQSIQDNSRIPPSVLVSELIDTIKEGFGLSEDQVVTHHKLQAFSPEYFRKDTKLFSYSKENLIAISCTFDRKDPCPFISTALSAPSDEWKRVDIDMLCSFFSNPVKFLLQRRLGIYLEAGATVSDERENFGLDYLEKYLLGQDLVKKRLSGSDLIDFLPIQRAMGQLPHGNVGEFVFSEMSIDADTFAGKIKNYTNGKLLDALAFDLDIRGFHLVGRLADIHEKGLVFFRYVKTKPKDLLKSWIYHLVLNFLNEKKYPDKSFLMCKDSTWEFGPINYSIDILEYLLTLYWKGMSEPLHFFPESSFEYAQKLLEKKRSHRAALNSAQKKWIGNDYNRGEFEDPYFDLCFSKSDPIDGGFQKIAEEVFAPLFEHCTEVIIKTRKSKKQTLL